METRKNKLEQLQEIIDGVEPLVREVNIVQTQLKEEFEKKQEELPAADEIENALEESKELNNKIQSLFSAMNMSLSSSGYAQQYKQKMKDAKEDQDKWGSFSKNPEKMKQFKETYSDNKKVLQKNLNDAQKSKEKIIKNCEKLTNLHNKIRKKLHAGEDNIQKLGRTQTHRGSKLNLNFTRRDSFLGKKTSRPSLAASDLEEMKAEKKGHARQGSDFKTPVKAKQHERRPSDINPLKKTTSNAAIKKIQISNAAGTKASRSPTVRKDSQNSLFISGEHSPRSPKQDEDLIIAPPQSPKSPKSPERQLRELHSPRNRHKK